MNKKKIGIVTSNIYSAGGTTRSSLNLANEFLALGHEVAIYNVINRKKIANHQFMEIQGWSNQSITITSIKNIIHDTNFDVVIITRESYFKLALVIKQANPQTIIVGEVHGPLSFITETRESLSSNGIDLYRLASQRIGDSFEKKFNLKNYFTLNVSLLHIIESFADKPAEVTNNLLCYSRFEERSKKISKIINLARQLGSDYSVYLNGYGPEEATYKKIKEEQKITNVLINQEMPNNYVYISTSDYETLGYSIAEAIGKGKKTVLTKGLDYEVYHLYQEFNGIYWLTDTVDLAELKAFMAQPLTLTEYLENQELYYTKFVINNYGQVFLSKMDQKLILRSKAYLPVLSKKEQRQIINKLEPNLLIKILTKINGKIRR
ncbi:hypothetical protein [Vagococcus xieshaowenii]|uniref:Uncharacterized protein n=1 Tax=Vagococcus xieshaowenii TaxID=2562451 RepID=A0A4Z0D2S8_9ENTE|nr:hypothetical protein [Vagococcus xieshaowenii]QCA29267.1 hypothetical protein E4Z98_08025 [Vagococcus xieshaowenii]TFZ39847.1 hypothetical protein E4031_08430 [Vagococcus xieshaowenii]